MYEDLDLDRVTDEYARACIARLLNAVEELLATTRALREENQRLRDEVQRLKGEQGAPRIPGTTRKGPQPDYSSEGSGGYPSRGPRRSSAPGCRSIGSRCWKSIRRRCLATRSSRAMRRWWSRICCSGPTRSVSTKPSGTRPRPARVIWPRCPWGTKGSSAPGSRR